MIAPVILKEIEMGDRDWAYECKKPGVYVETFSALVPQDAQISSLILTLFFPPPSLN